MKDLFFGILSFFLIAAFAAIASSNRYLQEPKHDGGIVIEKSEGIILGYFFHIKYGKDSIDMELVYEIFYDKYEVGDTIKNEYINEKRQTRHISR